MGLSQGQGLREPGHVLSFLSEGLWFGSKYLQGCWGPRLPQAWGLMMGFVMSLNN